MNCLFCGEDLYYRPDYVMEYYKEFRKVFFYSGTLCTLTVKYGETILSVESTCFIRNICIPMKDIPKNLSNVNKAISRIKRVIDSSLEIV